jgi:hypothetical protein
MRNYRFIKALMYILVSLTLTLTSCGGEGGGAPPNYNRASRAGGISGANRRTVVLKTISITPSDPVGINSGTQLQFAATGAYSDNSVQDVTTMVAWTSSDIAVATISNAPDSKGQVTAVSRGYCSISATLDSISGSTIIGVN